jgi:MarR family 2-MHQ and catechol resistance regulon transcriptional repressor
LIRASESLRNRINIPIIKKGITESQFYALDALYHLGPLNQKEIGEKLFRTGGNITLIIDNLEKQGLVRRERGILDRRSFTIHLTAKGKNLFKRIFPWQLKLITEEINLLNDEEQIQMQKLCKLLGLKKRE